MRLQSYAAVGLLTAAGLLATADRADAQVFVQYGAGPYWSSSSYYTPGFGYSSSYYMPGYGYPGYGNPGFGSSFGAPYVTPAWGFYPTYPRLGYGSVYPGYGSGYWNAGYTYRYNYNFSNPYWYGRYGRGWR